MKLNLRHILVFVVLVVFIFPSGFFLSLLGQPYSFALFNAHSLLALAALGYFVYRVLRWRQAGPITTPQWLAIASTLLVFVGLIVTGGLQDTGLAVPAYLPAIHHNLPFALLACIALSLYALERKPASA